MDRCTAEGQRPLLGGTAAVNGTAR